MCSVTVTSFNTIWMNSETFDRSDKYISFNNRNCCFMLLLLVLAHSGTICILYLFIIKKYEYNENLLINKVVFVICFKN